MLVSKKYLFYPGVVLLFLAMGTIIALGTVKIDDWRKVTSEKLLTESQKTEDSKKGLIYLEEASLLYPSESTYLYTGIKAEEIGFNNIAAYYLKHVKTATGFRELANVYNQNGKYVLAETNYKKSLKKENDPDTWYLLGKNYLNQAKALEANYAFVQAIKLDESNLEAKYYMELTALLLDENKAIDLGSLEELSRQSLVGLLTSKTQSTRINRLFSYIKGLGYPQLAYEYLRERGGMEKLDRDGYLLLANELLLRKDFSASYQVLLKAKEIDQNYPQTYQHLIEVAKILGKFDEAKQHQLYLGSITW